MATLLNNEFAHYEFTEEEEIQGAIFNTLQKQVIQTLLAERAEERLSLKFDPKNPNEFVQQEASLQGQIEAYKYLLIASLAAEESLKPEVPETLNT